MTSFLRDNHTMGFYSFIQESLVGEVYVILSVAPRQDGQESSWWQLADDRGRPTCSVSASITRLAVTAPGADLRPFASHSLQTPRDHTEHPRRIRPERRRSVGLSSPGRRRGQRRRRRWQPSGGRSPLNVLSTSGGNAKIHSSTLFSTNQPQ